MFFLCFCFLNLENLFFLSYKISKEEAVNFKVFLIEPICQIESIHASFSLTSSLGSGESGEVPLLSPLPQTSFPWNHFTFTKESRVC